MELRYKNFLILQLDKGVIKNFWEEPVIRYAASLGHNGDFYDCWSFLMKIKDEDYCGEGFNPKAKYYLYDGDGFYWFINRKDATMFGGVEANNLFDEYNDVFARYRRHWRDGYLWLYPEDIDDIESIAEEPKKITCEERNVVFDTEEAAAKWLVDIGKAASVQSAMRQLKKNLDNETRFCYGLKFIKY